MKHFFRVALLGFMSSATLQWSGFSASSLEYWLGLVGLICVISYLGAFEENSK